MKDTNIRQTITRNLNELMEKNRIRAIDLPNGADLNIFVFFKNVIGTIINLQNKNSRG